MQGDAQIDHCSKIKMGIHFLFLTTLESVIDVGQGISVVPGRFGKKNKRRALKIWKKE
jgi:hypothetical protein